MRELILIAAIDENRGIGLNGKIPWNIPEDMKFFKDTTINNTVVMGRKTYESLNKPLNNRRNIIISKKLATNVEFEVEQNPDKVFKLDEKIFIIGGETIYKYFINYADKLLITKIEDDFKCDTFFPEIKMKNWELIKIIKQKDFNSKYRYNFFEYKRKK